MINMDKAGLEEIRAAIQSDISAKVIEARLRKIYRGQSDVANLTVHAAYYLQSNPAPNNKIQRELLPFSGGDVESNKLYNKYNKRAVYLRARYTSRRQKRKRGL